jgi:hypothetical protein
VVNNAQSSVAKLPMIGAVTTIDPCSILEYRSGMRRRNELRASLGLLLVASVASAVAGCGGGSDSEVATGGQSSSAGSSSSQGGDAATGASTGAGARGGSAGTSSAPEGGSTDASEGGATADPGGDCEARQSWTEAIHYTLDVTWPGTTAGEKGSGKINIWSRLTFTASGNTLDVGVHACGSVLPETNLTVAGQFATGGKKVLIEVAESVWDAPSIPITKASGKQSGFASGSSVEFSYVSQLGVKLADPMMAWPASGADLETFDLEGDGASGYTATPRSGGGYVLPPTAVGLGGSAPAADKVYLVSRQGMTLKGKRTACDAHSGTAEVSAFDNHVVGCHIKDGKDCDEGQVDFVDQNRMRYMVSSAKYEAKIVADDASCGDVRVALPAK